jgi:hypothetical protein
MRRYCCIMGVWSGVGAGPAVFWLIFILIALLPVAW